MNSICKMTTMPTLENLLRVRLWKFSKIWKFSIASSSLCSILSWQNFSRVGPLMHLTCQVGVSLSLMHVESRVGFLIHLTCQELASNTANPTWGDIFESSKLKARTALLPRVREKRRSSFELWNSIRKCHPKWDWLYMSRVGYLCLKICPSNAFVKSRVISLMHLSCQDMSL